MHALAREELMLSCAGAGCALIHNELPLEQGRRAPSMQIFPD